MSLKRREFLRSAALGTAALLNGPLLSSCLSAKKKPNIILIMADDVGFEGFGCYGSTTYRTPHIDELARTGVRFGHCYATPLCTPSRVQLMTGQYNYRNYAEFGTLPKGETTFAHLLKKSGYTTYVAGKWQLLGKVEGASYKGDGSTPEEAGFDHYCLWQVNRLGSRYWNPLILKDGSYIKNLEDRYGPDVVCEDINRFFEEHQKHQGGPFFVYYPMILTHSPFVRTPLSNPLGEERTLANRTHFKEMVEYMDTLVGRLVRNLDELGLRDSTLLLFVGDNGTMRDIPSEVNGRTVFGAKGLTTDAGTHVPLIAHWKDHFDGGTVCDDLIDFTDFLPTLLDASGAESPAGAVLDGRSFWPQLFGKKGNPRDWIFCHYDPKWGNWTKSRYVQNKEFKLYDDGRFFDLRADILEENPLSRENLSPEAGRTILEFEDVLARMQ